MKIEVLVLLLLAFSAFAHAGQAPAGAAPGSIINPVVCKADPTQSYALYIPRKGNMAAMPVVYFFDPHGDGSLPLKKYKMLAEAYGFILVGSNNSRNGNDWSLTGNIWNRLADDVTHRLKIDSRRIYLCGFSGGAKVAGWVAIQHPAGVCGVIAGGAGLPDGVSAGDFPFSFTALAGEGDMNLTELVAITSEFDRTRTRHRIIVFDGKHEWAPLAVMDQAFAGWQLEAMHDGRIPKDPAFVNRVVAAGKSRLEAATRAGRLIRAEQECGVAISFLDGLTGETAWFKQKAAALAANPQFQKQRQTQEALLNREQAIKADYMQHFQQGDLRYWQQTIKDLETRAAAPTPERGMDQRLLAYLSLAFYSISNQLINGNDNNGARHFVELYKLADATNSEAWYFSAVLDVREGHPATAEADLLKAVDNGFRDKGRMRQQPEFQKAFTPMVLSRIEGRMQK